MARKTRQGMILDLIARFEIDTQEELQRLLAENNYSVTQATVSRDINQLNLVKIPGQTKKYRYAVDGAPVKTVTQKMSNMFRESAVSIDSTNNLLVIRTLAGSAESAGVLIDALNFEGFMCCICGDDAVLAVFKDAIYVSRAKDALYEVINTK